MHKDAPSERSVVINLIDDEDDDSASLAAPSTRGFELSAGFNLSAAEPPRAARDICGATVALRVEPPSRAGGDSAMLVYLANDVALAGEPQCSLGRLARVAALSLSAALARAPALGVRARVHSVASDGHVTIWLEIHAPAGTPASVLADLEATVRVAHATDASIALRAHLGEHHTPQGRWVVQPAGTDTIEWARAHLPSSIDGDAHPFVYLSGAAATAGARARCGLAASGSCLQTSRHSTSTGWPWRARSRAGSSAVRPRQWRIDEASRRARSGL
jgi:hypothetical protein